MPAASDAYAGSEHRAGYQQLALTVPPGAEDENGCPVVAVWATYCLVQINCLLYIRISFQGGD